MRIFFKLPLAACVITSVTARNDSFFKTTADAPVSDALIQFMVAPITD